jgi:hypothetical protein
LFPPPPAPLSCLFFSFSFFFCDALLDVTNLIQCFQMYRIRLIAVPTRISRVAPRIWLWTSLIVSELSDSPLFYTKNRPATSTGLKHKILHRHQANLYQSQTILTPLNLS